MNTMSGDKIKEYRCSLGMSKKEFAKKYNISDSTIWRWEKRTTNYDYRSYQLKKDMQANGFL